MKYLSFKEFADKHGLKDEATSNVKKKTKSLMTSSNVYMRDDKFTINSGIVNIKPTKGAHWVLFVEY